MNQKPQEKLYHCKLCGRSNFVKRGSHRHPSGEPGLACRGDFEELSPQSCFNCNFKASRACPDASVITRSPWKGCSAWFRQPASPEPADRKASILADYQAAKKAAGMPSAVAIVPTLNDGHDKATAKELLKRFTEAQTGLRRVVAFGLLAWEVKENKLKPGQFGTWMAAHCPSLTRIDSATGKPKPSSSLTSYMNLTKSVLESVGLPVNKYLNHISNSQQLGICHSGKYLLLPDKKLSPEALELKGKICELVDGKTAKQLFSEFKQAEEYAEGNLRVKHGRLKGQGGATAAHRESAQQRSEQDRLEALDLEATKTAEWLLQVADDKHLGMISSTTRDQLRFSLEAALGYLRNLTPS